MKVMARDIFKILPGKRAEALELDKKERAVFNRLGLNLVVTHYRPFARQGDSMHTLVYHIEFDSLAAMESTMEKAGADPEMREVWAKWAEITESRLLELYMIED